MGWIGWAYVDCGLEIGERGCTMAGVCLKWVGVGWTLVEMGGSRLKMSGSGLKKSGDRWEGLQMSGSGWEWVGTRDSITRLASVKFISLFWMLCSLFYMKWLLFHAKMNSF